MRKKVLIITYYWPPSGGSGVQRWLKFVKYLPQFGWDPIVYTVENGEFPVIDESLLKDIPPDVKIIKQPIWEPFGLYKKLTGKKKSEQFGHGFAGEKNERGLKKTVKNFAIWVRGNFFIPDARKFWIRPSVKFLSKYLKEKKIEYIITTGPPHSLHLIGLRLKKTNQIKWLADFRDPWTGVYYFPELKLSKHSFEKHRFLENEVLSSADKIITVGKTLKENLLRLSQDKLNPSKIEVITNGFDFEIKPQYRHPQAFSLVYTGLFSKDQNHDVLWDAISQCCKMSDDFSKAFSVHLYGKTDPSVVASIENFNLSEKLSLHGHVNLDEVGEIQRSAAMLLLCINHYPGEKEMLTGKLFDYIGSSRPILNIGPTDGDAAEIIHYTKTGITFSLYDKNGIVDYLMNCFELFKKHQLMSHPENVTEFHRRTLTLKLSKVLGEL